MAGGLLVQTRDAGVIHAHELRVVTQRRPSPEELDDLLFAWRIAKYVKSNAIVCVEHGATLGNRRRPDEPGRQQQDRRHEGRPTRACRCESAAMASDAFFPFRDGLDVAAEFGIKSVIQPGGSKRDADVIAAADEHGIAMVFTGMRHFRH